MNFNACKFTPCHLETAVQSTPMVPTLFSHRPCLVVDHAGSQLAEMKSKKQ